MLLQAQLIEYVLTLTLISLDVLKVSVAVAARLKLENWHPMSCRQSSPVVC